MATIDMYPFFFYFLYNFGWQIMKSEHIIFSLLGEDKVFYIYN